MRIRSIKPEFWRSADITGLSIDDRLLFIGLWSYVDDNGVGIDREPTIIGDLFAADMFRDSRETVARVSRGLQNLSEASLITRYTVEDRPFLFITNWSAHQRIDKPGKPRYPRPDDENAILATLSRDRRESVAPGAGEQGSRGAGEITKTSLRQSRNESGPVVTDDALSPTLKRLSLRHGITSVPAVWAAVLKHTSRNLSPEGAFDVALWILAKKSGEPPRAPQRYVTGAISRNPFEVQQYIDEGGTQ